MTGTSAIFSTEGKRLGKIYSQAIFSLAAEQKIIDDVKTDLDALVEFADREKDLLPFLASPYFNFETKKKLIEGVFANRLTELTMKFLFVVIKNNRIEFLGVIAEQYSSLWFDYYQCCPVSAVVSEPLSDERKRILSHKIAAALGKNIELKFAVDPLIIGGIILRYQGNLIDNSVKRRLVDAIKTIKSHCSQRGQIDEI